MDIESRTAPAPNNLPMVLLTREEAEHRLENVVEEIETLYDESRGMLVELGYVVRQLRMDRFQI